MVAREACVPGLAVEQGMCVVIYKEREKSKPSHERESIGWFERRRPLEVKIGCWKKKGEISF